MLRKAKSLIVAAVTLLMLLFGAITVYAVSAEPGKAPAAEKKAATADYAAEEMAVGAYYEMWAPEAEEAL